MTKQTNDIVTESKDNTQIAGILYKLIWASWIAFLFELITGVYYNDRNLIIAMLIGSALLLIPFILIRRGYVQFGSLITLLIVLGTVTYIAMLGEGIRDIAVISFPIIIIFAGLTLNKRKFEICVGLTIIAAFGLVFGEEIGWFVVKPFNGINSNWFYLLGVTIILLIAALVVNLLAKNIRRTMELTEQEFGERKRAEIQNRIISEVQDVLLHPFELDDAYRLVSVKVRELVGDCITVTSILEARSGKLCMNSIQGLDTKLEKLLPILGFDPREKEFLLDEISEEDFRFYRSGKLEIMKGGVYAFTAHLVPQSACLVIEKLLRVQKIYVMGFIHDKEFLGSLAILARGDISSYLGIIEQIMNLAIIAIDRKRAEDEVKKNEKRFQAMIEHGRDNISLLAADGTLLWENPSANSTLGYDMNQHIGHNIFELIHPDDQDWARNMYVKVSQTPGKFLEGETRLMHSDGTWRWIECTATNLLEEPSVLAIVLNYRDITERKTAQVTVLESETRYKTLFENSPVALWEEDFSQVVAGVDAISLNGELLRQFLEAHPEIVFSLLSRIKIIDVNLSTLQLYGYEDKQLLLENSSNLFKNVSHEALVDELMAMSNRQSNYEIIVDNSRRDGKVINVRVRWSVYPGHETEMSRVIVNTADITHQVQAISVQAAIYRISQAASATENLQELYKSIHTILGELMPAKNFYIALYDGIEGMISFPYHVDEMDPQPKPRKFGNGWTEYVIRTGRPVLLSPENLEKLEEEEGVRTTGSNSIDWLGVPLKVEDRIIGMVAVQTYTEGVRYTEVEKEILVFVSNQIAMAIDRKRIEETLKYSSTHEPLTGLYNRGYYEEEIKRLSSGRQFPVGVIMMDIDGLKVINDKYGHASGDELLKSFALVLQKEFRSNDVVARIGGDEFSVLLPLSPMKIVKKAVERTQKSVNEFNLLNPKIRLSFSVGYFTTESGDSVLDAIKHADALMYHDKTSKKAARLV